MVVRIFIAIVALIVAYILLAAFSVPYAFGIALVAAILVFLAEPQRHTRL